MRRAHPIQPKLPTSAAGMTLLEVMIVLAIFALVATLGARGLASITKSDLAKDAGKLAVMMQRTVDMASGQNEMFRMVVDLDKQVVLVEQCQGHGKIVRNDTVVVDEQSQLRAIERAKQRMQSLPPDALGNGDADAAMRRTAAVAGHHIGDRICKPAVDQFSQKPMVYQLNGESKIKFGRVYVQHRSEPQTSGLVAIYFFGNGSAEKAIVEVTDGSVTYSLLLYGLGGRVELVGDLLGDPETHMLRNPLGDKEKPREGE